MSDMKITYLDKVIHEINGHVHNIGLISDMMMDSKVEFSEEDNKINLQHIQAAAGKLGRIIAALSKATNLKADKINLELEELDLIKFLEKEVKYYQVRNRMNNNLRIDFNNKVQSCRIKADEVWFDQLITNLIMNAVNHAGKGVIEVTADIVKKDGADHFFLSVRDEGEGIPDHELETIFQPLGRGTGSTGKVAGSGIGLAVAREVAEAHNGSIVASNNPKAGATFEVLLPLNV